MLFSMLVVYALLTLGVQLRLHFCCGELSDIHVFDTSSCERHDDTEKNCCKKPTCCSFVDISFKTDETHEPLPSFELPSLPPVFLNSFEHTHFQATLNDLAVCEEFESPPPQAHRRYLLFRSLVYYA